MKTITQKIITLAIVLLPCISNAQSIFDKIFEKYDGKPGYTCVSVSNDMFHLFASMANSPDSSTVEMREMMNRLTGLRVVTCDVDATTPLARAIAFYNEAAAAFPQPAYQELMKVDDKDEHILFLTKKDAGGTIRELVMLVKSNLQGVAMRITGNINLHTVSLLSRVMDIKGMENLKEEKEGRRK